MDVDEKDQIMMTNVWLNLVRKNVQNCWKLLQQEYFLIFSTLQKSG